MSLGPNSRWFGDIFTKTMQETTATETYIKQSQNCHWICEYLTGNSRDYWGSESRTSLASYVSEIGAK